MSSLAPDGERYHPEQRGAVRSEHLHRYDAAFALVEARDVLDIACGEGYGSALLARSARSVVGVDISPPAIAHAERTYARENLRFALGSTAAIPLAVDAVDVVVSFETLEHVDDHAAMLAEIRRVLRPDGVLIVSTPDRPTYNASIVQPNPHHVSELDRAEFAALLRCTFPAVRLYGQGMVAGSLLLPLGEEASAVRVSGADDADGAIYIIAVCGAQLESLPRLGRSLFAEGGFAQYAALNAELARARLVLEGDDAGVVRARLARVRGGDALAAAVFAACRDDGVAAPGVVDRFADAALTASHAFALQGATPLLSGWCRTDGADAADAIVVTVADHVFAAELAPRGDLRDASGAPARGVDFAAALPGDLQAGFHPVDVWAVNLAARVRRRVSAFELIVLPNARRGAVTERLWFDRLEVVPRSADVPAILHAAGWGVDASGGAFRTVALVIDDATLVPLAGGDERRDVAAHFGLADAALGWHGAVPLAAGEHTVVLVALGTGGGEVSAARRTVRVAG